MTFSLESLNPQIVDVKLMGYGNQITIPLMSLSYVQWNNALLGITPPKAPVKRKVEDPSKPPVEYLDTEDLGYKAAVVEYNNTIRLRRLAMAMAGAGVAELQGLSLDEQVKLLRDKDAGILSFLYEILERMATKRTGAWFRRGEKQLSGDDTSDKPTDGDEPESVSGTP